MSKIKTACIYYLPKLEMDDKLYQIDNGITISKVNDSREGEILFQLKNKQKNIEIGEQNSYDLCLTIESAPPLLVDSEPNSLLNRITNLLALNTYSPVVEGNIISTEDDFQTARYEGQLYYFSDTKFEYFTNNSDCVGKHNLNQIKKSWENLCELRKVKSRTRVRDALKYYYYSWNSPYIEPLCINIAVIYEILFAPHSHSETTHQIAYNVAYYSGKDSVEREKIYRKMKKFYAVRSSIIHGGQPNIGTIEKSAVEAFKLCSKILQDILIDMNKIKTFNDEKKRAQLINSYLF